MASSAGLLALLPRDSRCQGIITPHTTHHTPHNTSAGEMRLPGAALDFRYPWLTGWTCIGESAFPCLFHHGRGESRGLLVRGWGRYA